MEVKVKTLEDTIEEVLSHCGGNRAEVAKTIAAHVRGHFYVLLLDRATETAGTDYRMGYEDGIRESARWVLRGN